MQISLHFDGISFLNFVSILANIKVGLPFKEEIPNALENSPILGHALYDDVPESRLKVTKVEIHKMTFNY